jgi:hypothetical protein
MRLVHQPDAAALTLATRRLARVAAGALMTSVGVMVVLGLRGPSLVVPKFPPAVPWPPYFSTDHPPGPTTIGLALAAICLGGLGLAAALLAARSGWRPRPRRLIIGCLLAVIALILVPPLGSTDMLDYAIYGRIAVLGHSPYVMTPTHLTLTGDPVGQYSPYAWRHKPSVYGPLATVSEQAASELAGPSTAKTVFWLKVWNGLAFLAVALALDRLLRSDAAARTRAHLLWTVNPLMLWAVMAGGHIDGLPAAAGFLGLLCLRRPGAIRGLAAGLLIGAAAAVKAPFVFFLLGVAGQVRRSPRTLAAAALGAAAVLVPSYLLAGPAAIAAVAGRAAAAPDVYQPWQLLTRALAIHPAGRFTDVVALFAVAAMAAILLWRLPSGSPSPAAMPFARPVLAVSLAWLIWTPQQRPWFDAMIFPLLAVLPATRLDWIVVLRALVGAVAELPGAAHRPYPPWLGSYLGDVAQGILPAILVVLAGALLWLCFTGRWRPPGPAWPAGRGQPLPDLAASGSFR